MENWQFLLCQGCQVWEVWVVWYHQWGSFVCCFLCWWSEGIFLAEVFSPFDLLLYGGFIITAAGEVFLQICSSLVECLCLTSYKKYACMPFLYTWRRPHWSKRCVYIKSFGSLPRYTCGMFGLQLPTMFCWKNSSPELNKPVIVGLPPPSSNCKRKVFFSWWDYPEVKWQRLKTHH